MLSDPLAENDLASRNETPARKLAQALDLMEAGLRLKRAALAHAQKDATSHRNRASASSVRPTAG